MSRLTERQINKMIQEVRQRDPNKIAGFAVFPKTHYSDANDMYFQLQEGYNRCIKELKDLQILNLGINNFVEDFKSVGFPRVVPNIEVLDVVFVYIIRRVDTNAVNNFKIQMIYRYIGGDEIEYSTDVRLFYQPEQYVKKTM